MIISINTKKSFDKNPTHFYNNNTHETRNRRELLQPTKEHV